jgi:hypothetical protein
LRGAQATKQSIAPQAKLDCFGRTLGETGEKDSPRRLGPIIDISGILDHPLSRTMTARAGFHRDIAISFV